MLLVGGAGRISAVLGEVIEGLALRGPLSIGLRCADTLLVGGVGSPMFADMNWSLVPKFAAVLLVVGAARMLANPVVCENASLSQSSENKSDPR